jgi:hypothetical protein
LIYYDSPEPTEILLSNLRTSKTAIAFFLNEDDQVSTVSHGRKIADEIGPDTMKLFNV